MTLPHPPAAADDAGPARCCPLARPGRCSRPRPADASSTPRWRSARPHALMGRAGLGVARLALALVPRARQVWVAAGPGNNGGDGLLAAMHLRRAGLAVRVNLLGDLSRQPADAAHALVQAKAAGVDIAVETGFAGPGGTAPDLVIDALLGSGKPRAHLKGAIAEAIASPSMRCRRTGARGGPALGPTCGDTGQCLGEAAVSGRYGHAVPADAEAGTVHRPTGATMPASVWLDALGVDAGRSMPPAIRSWPGRRSLDVSGCPSAPTPSHKGSHRRLGRHRRCAGHGLVLPCWQRAPRSPAGAGRVFVSPPGCRRACPATRSNRS